MESNNQVNNDNKNLTLDNNENQKNITTNEPLINQITNSNNALDENITTSDKNYNELIEALKKQTLINDEQRSYIEVLKQTLESNLLKNGLLPIIPSKPFESTLNTFENNKFSPENLNYLIDLSKLSSEIEKLKEELKNEKLKNEELQSKINSTKKDNQDLQNVNLLMKEKLILWKEKGDEVEARLKLERQREIDLQNIKNLKDENSKLKDNLTEVEIRNKKYEKDILDYGRKIADLKNQLQEFKNLEKEYQKVKDLNIKLSFDNEKINAERKIFEDKLNLMNKNIELIKAEKLALNKKLNDKEIEMQNEKKKYYIEKAQLLTKLTKATEDNNDLKNQIHDKEAEILELQQKQIENEKKNLQLESENNDLQTKYDDLKNENDIKNDILNKKNEDLIKQLKRLDEIYRKAEEQNSNILKSISEYKEKIKEYEKENKDLKNEIDNLKFLLELSKSNFEKKNKEYLDLNDTIIKLENENHNFKKELPFWKEKYKNDMKLKNDEEDRIKNTINELNNKINDFISNNHKILNSNGDLLTQNKELENDIKELYAQFSKVKDDNTILSKELQDKLKIIQIYSENKKKSGETLNNQISQINELEGKINNLISEKNNLEDKLGEFNCEHKKLIDNFDKINRELESVKALLNTKNKIIEDCSDIIISYIEQLRKLAFSQDNKKIYFTEHYNHFINSCDILSAQNNITPLDKLKLIKNFLTESSVENFNWYRQIAELEEANRLLDDTNISLKNQIFDYADTVNKANKYIEDNENKFHKLLDDNYKFKQNHSDLVLKYNKQNEKINCMNNELNNMQEQNCNLTCLIHQLNRENMYMDNELNKTSYDLNILEKRFDVLNREKDSCENLLDKIVNTNSKNINDSFSNISNIISDNNLGVQFLTSIPNNNKNDYDNNYNTFFDTDSNNRFQHSILKSKNNDTQVTSPNSDNINIEVNNDN